MQEAQRGLYRRRSFQAQGGSCWQSCLLFVSVCVRQGFFQKSSKKHAAQARTLPENVYEGTLSMCV